jgi:hypothetical protein
VNISLQAKHRRLAAEQARLLARILPKDDDPVYRRPTQATAAGDEQRLRGLPAVGRGVSGAIRFTSPHNQRFD